YTVGTCVPSLYINGGTFANQFANNQSFATQWYMTGGTVTTVAVPQGNGINFNTGFNLTTYPTNVSVLFNAPIVIRGTGLTFIIGKGTVPGGVDIICNSNINGGSYIVMSGTGTLQLNDTNSFTGGVQINGGELQVGIAEQPGLGSPLGLGTISFGGGSLQYSAANQYDYSGRFSTASGQLFSIDTAGQSVTLATNLSSSGGTLTKLGLGTLTLTAANGYTGLTTVSNGTLLLGTGGSIAASSGVSIAAGATFDVVALGSPYTFGAGSSLIASGTTASPATINAAGTVSLGSIPITLNYDSTDAAPQPALNVSGALSLNGNAFTVNTLSGLPLANGVYVVAQASSVATAGTYPPVLGTAIGPTSKGAISVSGAQVLLTVSSINANPPPIQFSLNGNTLTLSWPTNSGWTLQSNSINIAVPTDWFSIPGSSSVTTFPINVNTAKTNVFYRLFLP
ncbi:MAG TPA: autotransporter-associated beta strand repeat-containing protein, partial [Candidatus Acidoferrum sp.]|nr:autotransporter-associated beta strand repeat-containing protein [Candidatus Acidoferrum sp.]